MLLPEYLLEALRKRGLAVGVATGPEILKSGWNSRTVVARGSTEADGVTTFHPPYFWIFENDEVWYTQAHHNDRDQADFFRCHDNADVAVYWIMAQLARGDRET